MVESKETARDWKGNRRLEHGICTGEKKGEHGIGTGRGE
jgi:hypothetical protein